MAIPLIGVIAGLALLAGFFTSPQRHRRIVGALVLAALGAGSLRAGLGTDQLGDLHRLLPASAGDEREFLLVGLGLVAFGVIAALILAAAPVRPESPAESPLAVRRPPAEWVVLLTGLLALVSPWLAGTLGLAVLAGGIDLLLPGRPLAVRLALACGLILLTSAGYLVATIVGPSSSSYSALRDGPIGDPAARLLVLLIAPAALLYHYRWSLMPAGAALLGRVAGAVLPAGLIAWQPLGMPLALAGAGVGVWLRQPAVVALSLGSYGLWSGNLRGWLGGALLLLAAFLHSLFGWPGYPGRERLAGALAAAGLMFIVAGGLLAQVGYSVLLAVSAAILLIVRRAPTGPVASP